MSLERRKLKRKDPNIFLYASYNSNAPLFVQMTIYEESKIHEYTSLPFRAINMTIHLGETDIILESSS